MVEFGYSPLGVIIQEDIRALDFLLSRFPEIDQNKIGCIGHSFGGIRCMYLAAIDNRIKVIALSNSIERFRESPNFGGVQTWMAILPKIAQYTGGNGMLALISPRPLILFYSENDPIFPAEDVEFLMDPLKKVYDLLGKKDNLKIIKIQNSAHEFPTEYHYLAYEFFDKYFKNNESY